MGQAASHKACSECHESSTVTAKSLNASSVQHHHQAISSSPSDKSSNEVNPSSEHEESHTSNSTSIETLQRHLEQMDKKHDEKNGQLMEFITQLKESHAQLMDSHSQFVSNAKLITDLQAECQDKDKRIDQMREESAEKDGTIQKLQEEMDQLSSCDEEVQDNELPKKNDQVSFTLNELKQIVKSADGASKLVKILKKRADELRNQGQYVEAVNCYENIIEFERETQNRQSKLAKFFVNKSLCHAKLKQYQQTFDSATLALSYNPDSSHALVNRAAASNQLGNYTKACADFEKALELTPSYETALKGLAIVQEKLAIQVGKLE